MGVGPGQADLQTLSDGLRELVTLGVAIRHIPINGTPIDHASIDGPYRVWLVVKNPAGAARAASLAGALEIGRRLARQSQAVPALLDESFGSFADLI
jgi:hypothetical protein